MDAEAYFEQRGIYVEPAGMMAIAGHQKPVIMDFMNGFEAPKELEGITEYLAHTAKLGGQKKLKGLNEFVQKIHGECREEFAASSLWEIEQNAIRLIYLSHYSIGDVLQLVRGKDPNRKEKLAQILIYIHNSGLIGQVVKQTDIPKGVYS